MLTLHMYGSTLRTRRIEKVMAWGVETLRERSAVARSAGLPLLLEEVNWKARDDAERARVLGAWLAEAERPEHAHTVDVLRAPQSIG